LASAATDRRGHYNDGSVEQRGAGVAPGASGSASNETTTYPKPGARVIPVN
jgi:hypothetical protein